MIPRAAVAGWCAAAALLCACAAPLLAQAPPEERAADDLPTFEMIGSAQIAMFNGVDSRRIGGLSGLMYDGGRWIAVTDDKRWSRVVELAVDVDAGAGRLDIRVIGVADLPGTQERPGAVREYTDGEAIAPDGEGGFFIGFEEPTQVVRFREAVRAGPGAANSLGALRRLAVFPPPAVVRDHVRFNRGFESVAVVGNPRGGREVWAATEAALDCDGPEAAPSHGSHCRAVVFDAETGAVLRQHVYETGPSPRGLYGLKSYNSLSEWIALAPGRLLSLERRFGMLAGYDATLRVVDLFRGETDVSGVASISEAIARDASSIRPLSTRTVTTVCTLGAPWSANYEAMAIGPELKDEKGGRLVIVLADDNFGDDGQVVNAALALRLTTPSRGGR